MEHLKELLPSYISPLLRRIQASNKSPPILRSGPKKVQSILNLLVSWTRSSEETSLDFRYPPHGYDCVMNSIKYRGLRIVEVLVLEGSPNANPGSSNNNLRKCSVLLIKVLHHNGLDIPKHLW